jgi:uncharacterized membrane protein
VTPIRAAILATAVAGAVIATYLTFTHYAHVSPICTSGGCETVQRSSYAELAGVPVALLGLIAYCSLAATTLRRGVAAATAGVVIALGGAGFSAYLLWAQLDPIGALCQWCLANDVVIALAALLSLVRLATEPS